MKRSYDMITMLIDEKKNSNCFEVFMNLESRNVIMKYHEYRNKLNMKATKKNNLSKIIKKINENSNLKKLTIIYHDGDINCNSTIISQILANNNITSLIINIHGQMELDFNFFNELKLYESDVNNITIQLKCFSVMKINNNYITNFDFLLTCNKIKSLTIDGNCVNQSRNINYFKMCENRFNTFKNELDKFNIVNIISQLTLINKLKFNLLDLNIELIKSLKIISETCKNISVLSFKNSDITTFINIVSDGNINGDDRNVFSYFPSLKSISIINCDIYNYNTEIKMLFKNISNISTMKKFVLKNSLFYTSKYDFEMTDEYKIHQNELIQFECLTNITYLDISKNKLSKSFELFSLFKLISLSNNLKKINLKNCFLIDNDIGYLLKSLNINTSLSDVNIKSNIISNEMIYSLIQINSSILYLDKLSISKKINIIKCNPYLHQSYSDDFILSISSFLLCIKISLSLKIPKPVKTKIFGYLNNYSF